MKNLIEIIVLIEEQIVFRSNYMILNKESYSFVREIEFKNVRSILDEKVDLSDEVYGKLLEVHVIINGIRFDPTIFVKFKVHIIDLEWDNIACNLSIKGTVYLSLTEYHGSYFQPTIDILNKWQNNESCNAIWKNREATKAFKEGYFYACFLYSGLHTDVMTEIVNIDWGQIEDEDDFLFYASEAFFGERGYIGSGFRGFIDCIEDIRSTTNSNSKFKGVNFINTDSIQSNEVCKLQKEVEEILFVNGFFVVYQS